MIEIDPEAAVAAAEAGTHAPPPADPPPAEPPPPPQHLYSAVTDRRENVLNSFAQQRNAIRTAVDEQRRAALAPIAAVQNKRRNVSPHQVQQQTAELILLLRQLVAEEVRRELARHGVPADERH